MSTVVRHANAFPVRSSRREQILFQIEAVIGGSGAVSSSTVSDPGCSIAKNATTGQYDLTYPASPANVHIWVEFYSPANTVSQNNIKAISETAGTASILCLGPTGSAAYPASSDKIYIDIIADGAVQ